jgi:hypothetical protein
MVDTIFLIIMESSRYKTVNTFSRPLNINQFIGFFVVTGLLATYFAAVQNNILDQTSRTTLTALFCISLLTLVVSTLVTCFIDPVDKTIPIYHSSQRATLSK